MNLVQLLGSHYVFNGALGEANVSDFQVVGLKLSILDSVLSHVVTKIHGELLVEHGLEKVHVALVGFVVRQVANLDAVV